MRLSDVHGERTLDVLAEIIDPVVCIATDEEAAKIFRREKCPEGKEPWQFFLERLRESLPQVIRSHKAELIKILSTLKGVSAEEYVDGMTFASLFADLVGLLTDKELSSFFS